VRARPLFLFFCSFFSYSKFGPKTTWAEMERWTPDHLRPGVRRTTPSERAGALDPRQAPSLGEALVSFFFMTHDRCRDLAIGAGTRDRCRGNRSTQATLLFVFFFEFSDRIWLVAATRCRKEQHLHTAADRRKKMTINEGPNEI
jgi:hypothetical protein